MALTRVLPRSTRSRLASRPFVVFNDSVTVYNTYRQTFPTVVFAGMFGHGQDAALLEYEDREQIQAAPTVSF